MTIHLDLFVPKNTEISWLHGDNIDTPSKNKTCSLHSAKLGGSKRIGCFRLACSECLFNTRNIKQVLSNNGVTLTLKYWEGVV